MPSQKAAQRPSQKFRALLRAAGLSTPNAAGGSAGPQVDTQASLESSERHEVGPDRSMQDRSDGGVVDAAERFGAAQTATVESLAEVDGQESGSFDGGVEAGSVGPVVDQLDRSRSTRAGHDQILKIRNLQCVSSSASFADSRTEEQPPPQNGGNNQHSVGDLVARAIIEYRPDMPAEDWAVVGPFVRDAVTDCDAKTPYAAKDLMAAASRHAWWCWRAAGLELDRGVVYRREVIGEYIARGCSQMSPASAGNRRSQLLRMSEILLPPAHQVAQLPALPPSKALEPYSSSELTALRSWASGLNTQYRREQAHLLLALGLGAGLSNAEILAVQAQHVHVDEQGVLIHVDGRRPRTVPVLALWERALIDYGNLRTLDSQQFVFRPRRQSQDSNTIGNFVDRTRPGVVKATAQRMRVTWIVTHLIAGSPLTALIQAAGVESLEALTRYLKFVPNRSLADVRAQFRDAHADIDTP